MNALVQPVVETVEVFAFDAGRLVDSWLLDASRVITIGSRSGAAVKLQDDRVRARHAVLHIEGARVNVSATSGAGVRVNGQTVEHATITGADSFEIGPFTLKVELLTIARRRNTSGSAVVNPEHFLAEPPTKVGPPPPPPATGQYALASPANDSGDKKENLPTARIATDEQEAPIESRPEPTRKVLVDQLEPTAEFVEVRAPTPEVPDEPELSEDELDELGFEAPFSLLDNVLDDRLEVKGALQRNLSAEVVSYREDRLIDVSCMTAGQMYEGFDAPNGRLVALFECTPRGTVHVLRHRERKVIITRDGETLNLADLPDQNKSVALTAGDVAHVRLGGRGYVLRFVRLPVAPQSQVSLRVAPETRRYTSLAIVGVVLFLLTVWAEAVLSPKETMAMQDEAVEFAELTVKDLELEKPEPPPPPPPPPEEAKATQGQPEVAQVAPKHRRRRSRRARGGEPGPTAAQQQAAAALSSLDNIVPDRAAGALSGRVSNVAVTRVPAGTTKRFRMAPSSGKGGGGEVVLSQFGGGGRATRSASNLLRGRNIGAVGGGGGTGTGRGSVRGVVQGASARRIGATGGRLSRAQIAKVVAAGTAEVQRCYERELIKQPKLQGKIVFDWVIATSGRVDSSRVRSSTLNSDKVAGCIGRVIKSWRFPKPIGGSVKVTYPFRFQVQGF